MSFSQTRIIQKLVLFSFAAVPALGASPVYLHAQVRPEIATLTNRTVEKVAKIHPQQILLSPLQGCLLNQQICEELDNSLRSSLESEVPGLRITGKADAIHFLKTHALPEIDVHDVDVLEIAGAEAGSGLLLTEDLQWTKKTDDAKIEIFDTLRRVKLNEFQTSILRPDPISDEEPLIYRDQESGVSLIISKKQGSKPKYVPGCQSCPDPRYTDEARAKHLEGVVVLLATITEQGVAAQITVLKTFDNSITQSALETVRGWKFKPAVGPDGKPFAVRIPIEITFRLTR